MGGKRASVVVRSWTRNPKDRQRPALFTNNVRRGLPAVAAFVSALGAVLSMGVAPAGSSSPANEGVTAKTISVGLPYVDFAALKSLGVTVNDGSFPDAYDAIIANINSHGGINGRKLVLSTVEMNPAEPASEASSCAQLTEDDKVFVAISPVFPDCYQQTHDTPVIAGSLPGTLTKSAAPDFALVPPNAPFDALQLAAFDKKGVFKGKKVGIFYGADSDAPEVAVVQADLKKLHIPVAVTAEDSAPATDSVASDQETQTIGLRFKNSGVGVVIGVGGSGSTTWPRAELDLQSTYKPRFIASDESAFLTYVQSTKGTNPYLDNAMAATSVPNAYQQWKDPGIQKCAAIVHKAYPSDTITAPVNPETQLASTDTSYQSVIEACQYLGLFAKIADAAGKNLTVASFTKAGYGLKHVTIPGMGGPISFGPGQPYALGSVSIVTYNPKTQALVPASGSGA